MYVLKSFVKKKQLVSMSLLCLVLCMGSLLLTVIELAKTIETMRTSSSKHRQESSTNYSQSVSITESITFIFRFLFHCMQFTYLFRYGNVSY
jgi:hypothetical protein